jgi:hypothetical protein
LRTAEVSVKINERTSDFLYGGMYLFRTLKNSFIATDFYFRQFFAKIVIFIRLALILFVF